MNVTENDSVWVSEFYAIEGRMSSNCHFSFLNATFKVGPASLAKQHQKSSCSFLSDAFIHSGELDLQAVIGLDQHTPTAQRLTPRNVLTQQNKKIQVEARVSADTDTTTHSSDD